MAEALLEELLEAVLLRIPPDDPASLLSAALVSKRWCRLICGRGFRRRFREFHGKPPLLGLVCERPNTEQNRFFLPTSSFQPRHPGDGRNLLVPLHSYHSRVLLYSAPSHAGSVIKDLFVWDPITDKLRKLPRWPRYSWYSDSAGRGNAAVLCAGGMVADGGCNNNIDCHHGPFMVVFVGRQKQNHPRPTFICVFSSEADRWSQPIDADQRYHEFQMGSSVVIIGSAVYFKCHSWSEHAILKYDLLTQEISQIRIPKSIRKGMLGSRYRQAQGPWVYRLTKRDGILEQIRRQRIVLLPMEDGRLGFACMPNLSTLSLWSWREQGPDGGAGWEQSRVIEPDATLIHKDYISDGPLYWPPLQILDLAESFSFGCPMLFSLSISTQ